MNKVIKSCITAIILALFLGVVAHGAENKNSEKEFNAGAAIIHHVVDSREIHLMTFNEGEPNEKHVSIPLPTILYTDENGLEVFSSFKFHDENHKYGRYILHHGKIYIANSNGGLTLDEKGHPTNVKPLDFSITKTSAGVLIISILLIVIFMTVSASYKKRKNQAPKGLQSFLEPLILFVRDEVAKPSIGKKHEMFMPYLLTIFFFIWIGNMLGLIPFIGGFNVTGNIAITATLAVFTFIITLSKGNKHYWQHIFNTPGVPWWLKLPVPLMPFIELIGVFSKPLVLCLRLFANIVGGHIIILSFVSLIFIFSAKYGAGASMGVSVVSLFFAVFMNVIEILVAFLQAYIFTLLSALYFGSAVEEHHETS